MADLNHSFDHFAFTSEEKEQLTDRLRQAAEQEERMKEPTKRIIRHTGHRLLIGAGACLLYTSPSPRDRSLSRMPSSA